MSFSSVEISLWSHIFFSSRLVRKDLVQLHLRVLAATADFCAALVAFCAVALVAVLEDTSRLFLPMVLNELLLSSEARV
jgi:hypothetical protein